MNTKSRWLVISGVCAFFSTNITAQGERLDLQQFNREIISSYNLKVSDQAKIDEWQAIEIKFKPAKGVSAELYYPARYIMRKAVPSSPHRGDFEVKTMHVMLGNHTSYFRLIYGVVVTLTPIDKPGQPPPKPLYGATSFVGKRSPDFLRSKEAKEAISAAILECISRLQPEN